MTIAHDTTTTATAYTSTGTQTTSHTGSASTKAVVVLIDQNGTVTDEVSGVTYGGTAMSRLRFDTEATEAGAVYIYYLLNPPTGTQNVAMTTTAATNKQLVCATMTGDPLKAIKLAGNATGTSAGASNPAWTITGLTASRKLEAYEVIHSGLQTMTTTPDASWTLISSTDLGSQGRGFARQTVASSGTSLVSGWIAATSEDYVGASVAFWEDDNLVPDEASSFEGGTISTWESNTVGGGYTAGTPTNSSTRADAGTKSLLMTWPTTVIGSIADVDVLGMVDGQSYKLSARVWVPSGHPDVRAEVIFFGAGSYVSTKDAWADVSVTFTANSALHALCGIQAASATSGQTVWIDSVRVVAVYAYTGDATQAATGTLTATGTRGRPGDASLAGTGTLTSAGTKGLSTGSSLAATGTLTATGTVGKVGNAALVATGTLDATGTVATTSSAGDAALVGTGTLTSTGTVAKSTGSALAGTGTLTATGTKGVSTGSALAGTATATTTGTVGKNTGSALAGTGTLTATSTLGKVGAATLAATGTLTATGTVAAAPSYDPDIPAASINSVGVTASIDGRGSTASITSPELKAAFT